MLHVCENGLLGGRPSRSRNKSSTAGESNAVSTVPSTLARVGATALDGSKIAVTVYSMDAGELPDFAVDAAMTSVKVVSELPAYNLWK